MRNIVMKTYENSRKNKREVSFVHNSLFYHDVMKITGDLNRVFYDKKLFIAPNEITPSEVINNLDLDNACKKILLRRLSSTYSMTSRLKMGVPDIFELLPGNYNILIRYDKTARYCGNREYSLGNQKCVREFGSSFVDEKTFLKLVDVGKDKRTLIEETVNVTLLPNMLYYAKDLIEHNIRPITIEKYWEDVVWKNRITKFVECYVDIPLAPVPDRKAVE